MCQTYGWQVAHQDTQSIANIARAVIPKCAVGPFSPAFDLSDATNLEEQGTRVRGTGSDCVRFAARAQVYCA